MQSEKNKIMNAVYTTSTDILYLVLTIVIALLGILLAIAIYHIIRILRDVNQVTDKVKDSVDLLNHYLWQPIKIFMLILEKMKFYKKKKE